jgi:hypothetical protein
MLFMRRFAIILVLAAFTAGCGTVDIRRVVELEKIVAQLENELCEIEDLGENPASLAVPHRLGREIEGLRVYRPYIETAVSIFPGLIFPGLGAHAIGDPEMGWTRMGEAYAGALEFTAGTGMTVLSLGAAAACASGDSGCCDGIGELFVTGVAYMVAGPVHYFGSWFGDIASTYYARDHLAARVEILKSRYRLFMRDYEQAHHYYNTNIKR